MYECEGLGELSAFLAGEGDCPSFLHLELGKEVETQTDIDFNCA